MSKHKMSKHQVNRTKLRKSKYFVTLENPKGNVPSHFLFPEKNTHAFISEAKDRKNMLVGYYGSVHGFYYEDLEVVEHGRLPFARAFKERCRRNMVSSQSLIYEAGIMAGFGVPIALLLFVGALHLFGLEYDAPFLGIAAGFFVVGSVLWTTGVPGRAVFQARKMVKESSTKKVQAV